MIGTRTHLHVHSTHSDTVSKKCFECCRDVLRVDTPVRTYTTSTLFSTHQRIFSLFLCRSLDNNEYIYSQVSRITDNACYTLRTHNTPEYFILRIPVQKCTYVFESPSTDVWTCWIFLNPVGTLRACHDIGSCGLPAFQRFTSEILSRDNAARPASFAEKANGVVHQ
jgi:hypothetical protein